MSEIKLNFKASNIAKAEDKKNKNFFKAISGMSDIPSMSDILFLFLAGGATEDEFDEIIAGGIENAMTIITEGLNESGFLGKKIDTTDLKKAIATKK